MIVLVTGLQGSGKSTIAEHCAGALGASMFAWDWAMAALTPFEPLQDAIRTLDRETCRALGWAMVLQSAREQLRRGQPVVLDGMARDRDVRAVRVLATERGVPSVIVMTTCDDLAVQRSRIEGRRRGIPGWEELTWEDVERSRASWEPPTDVDLTVDSTRPLPECLDAVLRAVTR